VKPRGEAADKRAQVEYEVRNSRMPDPCCCGGYQDRGCEGCPTSPALRRLTDERRKEAQQ
jgi:hypothetical protein